MDGRHGVNYLQTSEYYENVRAGEQDFTVEDENSEHVKKRRVDGAGARTCCFIPSKSFLEKLTREIMQKQEELHRAFLDTIERKDKERAMREDVYRRQEAAKLDREHELRAHEVSIAASRDAAIISFLEKIAGQSLSPVQNITGLPSPANQHPSAPRATPTACAITSHAFLQHPPANGEQQHIHSQALQHVSDADTSGDMNTKRWPKVEVHALIRLRSGMEPRFREAGPKAHLWQEISASMSCLGFIRSPKRCKEKWENINKYFKKTKDSSKKRPENAKTCPYFHQLDTLYQRGILTSSSAGNGGGAGKQTSKSEGLLEYNNHEDEVGFNIQSAVGMQGEADGQRNDAEHLQRSREKDIESDQMRKAAEQHGSSAPSAMGPTIKKSLQVEMFVKDILDLQQQQHQKLVEEYDRMEQAHELRELERQQMKTGLGTLSHGSTHDSSTLMALIQKLAGDSSDLAMAAPSSAMD
ncbi:hypothetical protein KP509_18G079000 [Ceratopteris richardii]|uniref:Myb-like domain-containing protein n=1 Tax=Ceratopteris richardii TaxID=49495 RepID=A0A8T2SRY2_CERRI|nr:hypothetical protein KP509_18G079000 [Ceratopteris richardii]KAH7366453.1 hypothetical protein KP509_18G079000 [Ceratopteris richardii]KAH7366454.1 hypothetical protein KP509_18G079000 [Ceratopteris richardii]